MLKSFPNKVWEISERKKTSLESCQIRVIIRSRDFVYSWLMSARFCLLILTRELIFAHSHKYQLRAHRSTASSLFLINMRLYQSLVQFCVVLKVLETSSTVQEDCRNWQLTRETNFNDPTFPSLAKIVDFKTKSFICSAVILTKYQLLTCKFASLSSQSSYWSLTNFSTKLSSWWCNQS